MNEEIINKLNAVGEINAVSPNEIKEALRKARKEELNQCLVWLQHRMDEYDDKEAYQDDYRIVSTIWNFMRSRMLTND
jgi:hypothetical protein